jgi:DNA-binding transcriptional ArsR family regulator
MTDANDNRVELDRAQTGAPVDELFRALGDATRRHILTVLSTTPETTLDELAEILVGATSTAEGPVGPDALHRMKVELVHVHLPVLADAELLSHEDRVVRRRDYPDVVDDLLAATRESEGVTPPERPPE